MDYSKLTRYRIKDRFSKVDLSLFASTMSGDESFSEFLNILPGTLKANDFKNFVATLERIIRNKRKIILCQGGHVIKVGLSPIVIDMIKSGWISHVAFNGSGVIHDFEIAYNASTSENVDKAIEDGSFGMAFETGKMINESIVEPEKGLGYNVGKFIHESNFSNKDKSILAVCYEMNVPLSVHVAIGTDIIHYHPEFCPKDTGIATFADFDKFVNTVSELEGGALLNFGSAVIIPEVFLKAITIVRNLGHDLSEIYTANFDFIQQYRPHVNVVKRPTSLGGKGYSFTGHHEIMMPLLYASLKSSLRS